MLDCRDAQVNTPPREHAYEQAHERGQAGTARAALAALPRQGAGGAAPHLVRLDDHGVLPARERVAAQLGVQLVAPAQAAALAVAAAEGAAHLVGDVGPVGWVVDILGHLRRGRRRPPQPTRPGQPTAGVRASYATTFAAALPPCCQRSSSYLTSGVLCSLGLRSYIGEQAGKRQVCCRGSAAKAPGGDSPP